MSTIDASLYESRDWDICKHAPHLLPHSRNEEINLFTSFLFFMWHCLCKIVPIQFSLYSVKTKIESYYKLKLGALAT